MGIFDAILDKLGFGSDDKEQAAGQVNVKNQVEEAVENAADTVASSEASEAPEVSAAISEVDVVSQLEALAAKSGGELNWKESIVDLMKLLGLDSSYAHRKELASEMGIENYEGTAEQNIALHKTVMQKLAENGGNIPQELLA